MTSYSGNPDRAAVSLAELRSDTCPSGGLVLLDSSGTICSCNETFFEVFSGTKISEIFPPGFRPYDLLRTAELLCGTHLTRQCTLSMPGGEQKSAKLLLNQIGPWWLLAIELPSGASQNENYPAVDLNFLEDQMASRIDIAKYLHDTVCQNLVAVSLSLARLQRNPGIATAAGLASAMELCDHCSREVRASINVLAPPLSTSEPADDVLAETADNAVSTLQWYVANLRETAGLRVSFAASSNDGLDGRGSQFSLQTSRFVRTLLCAAVQRWAEAAINRSAPTSILLTRQARGLELQIQSECPGDPPIAAVLSSSLIRESLRAIGGTIESRFSPAGDSVRLVISDSLAEGSGNKQFSTARAA